jgi:hypothetical protein
VRVLLAVAAAVTLAGAATPSTQTQLDSQYVLQRYALALDAVPAPETVVFSYSVSQAGLANIEQRHTIYRHGADERDETLANDGVTLGHKRVRFDRRADPYAVAKLAPRTVTYQMLFLGTVKDGRHVDYVYETTPIIKQSDAWIDEVTIDGARFLPRSIRFHTTTADARGKGTITYSPFGKFWLPLIASVDATVHGKPARERIAWSDYRFPVALPPSTFQAPKPLPVATLPPI